MSILDHLNTLEFFENFLNHFGPLYLMSKVSKWCKIVVGISLLGNTERYFFWTPCKRDVSSRRGYSVCMLYVCHGKQEVGQLSQQQQVAPDIPATVRPIALQQHSGGRGQATWALICPTVWILALCLILLKFALDILTVSFQSSNCYWKSREQGCEHTVGRQKIQNQKNGCWAIINRTKNLQNPKHPQ